MVELEGIGDYWGLIAIAAAFGAFGGLISVLLPGAEGRWWAGVLIGSGAAIAIMLVLPPTVDTTNVVDGQAETTTEYSVISLVATAIIAGSAGPRIFQALQERTLAAIAKERTQTTNAASQAALSALGDQIPGIVQENVATQAAPKVQQAAAASPAQAAVEAPQLVDAVASDAAASVEGAVNRQIAMAQDIVAAAASGGAPPSTGQPHA